MEKGNIFDDKIKVSVGITILIKKAKYENNCKKIFYYDIGNYLTSEEKKKIVEKFQHIYNVPWREIVPDHNHTWLTEGLQDEFDTFLQISKSQHQKDLSETIFEISIPAVNSGKDYWVYDSDKIHLENKLSIFIECYNLQVLKFHNLKEKSINLDDFVIYDDKKISWSATLKEHLLRKELIAYSENQIKISFYRPFYKQFIFFNKIIIDRPSHFPKIFPTPESEKENRVICITAIGCSKPFHTLLTNIIPDMHLCGDTQCFPFYIYNEDGTNRRENISDWALDLFRSHYQDETITKWDIFYYIYAVLHKKEYREKYAQNLRRSLPRVPFYEDFWKYAQAGRQLGELHIAYEQADEYPLEKIETPGKPLDYRVEKMYLSKDRRSIKYNEFLTLAGIPPETFEYRLGNRSALEWIIDQFRVKVDKRSGIVNDPNPSPDSVFGPDPEYIIRLIGKIITVSLKTIEIVNKL
ncbi:MAG: helicase [Ignavibacteria bacterium]|nr:helicase [Ignavibacteria bacterium]